MGILLSLFTLNGLNKSWRTPAVGHSGTPAKSLTGPNVRVLALNAAKCWFHEGGLSFADADVVRSRLDQVAAAIDAQHADIVFLSEVVMECGPVPIDQVEHLARRCGFANFASGDNYSFGLPFYRIRSGNAVLTSLPLRAVECVQLAGGTSFWEPTNNRRALWCEVQIGAEWLLVASIRNDSFHIDNNLRQVDEILRYAGERPALLAGDFNAELGTSPIRWLQLSGRFASGPDTTPTFPANAPTRRLDDIFGPNVWTVIDQAVFDTHVSDHLGVVTTFALPADSGRAR